MVQGLEEIDEVIASLSVPFSKDKLLQQKLRLVSMRKALGASILHLQELESWKTHLQQNL